MTNMTFVPWYFYPYAEEGGGVLCKLSVPLEIVQNGLEIKTLGIRSGLCTRVADEALYVWGYKGLMRAQGGYKGLMYGRVHLNV